MKRYPPKSVTLTCCLIIAGLLMAACARLPEKPAEAPAPAPPVVAAPAPAPPPCPPEALKPALALLPPEEQPQFGDDLDFAGIEDALQRSIDYYAHCGRTFDLPGGRRLSGADMADGLRAFAALAATHPGAAGLNAAIRRDFDVYASVANQEAEGVLFTGYYEPLVEASRGRGDVYRWPLYRRPPDLISIDLGLFRQGMAGDKLIARVDGNAIVPYYSREQIDALGCLAGRGQELAWARDPVDVFFLQIQGSGVIHFDDGTTIRVHYAGSNGRAFRSVGRLLVDEGRLPKQGVSMQAIRRYLNDHPDELQAVLNYNESYVFFEEVPEGPLGNIGVVLTGGRSIATDYRLFPGGALAWVGARKPVIEGGKIVRWERFNRFVLNQDTGGVITGPGRVDFFWGSGPEAALSAGGMREYGQLYFLVSKRVLPEPGKPKAENGSP